MLRNYLLKSVDKFWQVDSDNLPNEVLFYCSVIMSKNISLGYNAFPWDFRVFQLKIWRYIACCFAHYL